MDKSCESGHNGQTLCNVQTSGPKGGTFTNSGHTNGPMEDMHLGKSWAKTFEAKDY